MDRAEKTGLGIAIAGHVVLFGLLSVGFLATPNPMSLKSSPMDVALTDDIGLESSAPTITPPAQSIAPDMGVPEDAAAPAPSERSEEHTSELQSLMRISYAVFCLKKQRITTNITYITPHTKITITHNTTSRTHIVTYTSYNHAT